jgi:BirA family biotin operon repressor/biotin-[acetyl-CoA-carboxylase] ligase
VDHPFRDLDRPPLPAGQVARELIAGSALWRELVVLPTVSSTNDWLHSRTTEAEGLVVVAEEQTVGRGRLERSWSSPARAGLTLSFLLRPPVPAGRLPLLPLLVGLAVVDALTRTAELPVRLKWPNDVLAPSGRKLAGVLAETVGPAVVTGVGLNVSTRADELPTADATSLALEQAGCTDRTTLLKALLRAVERRYRSWSAAAGDPEPLLTDYRLACATVGGRVRLATPGGRVVQGTAVGVADDGALLVEEAAGVTRWTSADVVHLRPDVSSES